MTFKEFCTAHDVTEGERDQLLEHLAFLKFRSLLKWLEDMKKR